MRAALRLAVLLALVAAAPAAGAEARCHGHEVTIDGNKSSSRTLVGTDGPDVIQGSRFDEVIEGGGGRDVICGGGGDDDFDGGPDVDRIYGEAGNDRFLGVGLAEDIVIGGPGRNSVLLRDNPVGVRVDLTQEKMLADGARRYGRLRDVRVVGGTRFADELIGDQFDNRLLGLDGNDVLDGRSGDNDLIGGEGINKATYAASSVRVVADLGDGVAVGNAVRRASGHRKASVDTLQTIDAVEGTDFDDVIKGSRERDYLIGGKGDDVIKGRDGNDGIDGGAGSDTIHPGPGDDIVNGGPNDPVTGPGAKTAGDTVSAVDGKVAGATPGGHPYTAYEAFLTYDRFGNPPGSIGEGEDVFIGIESLRGMANSPNDLEGDEGVNVLIGGKRSDYLQGGSDDDFLFGLGAGDTIDGGDGDDYLDGGGKNSDDDADKLDGGAGSDSCNGAQSIFVSGCELGVTGA